MTLNDTHSKTITGQISKPTSPDPCLSQSLAIPAQYGLCSLRTVVARKWLGPEIKDYIECLQKIARNIAQLHSHRLLLCDFDADSIYVENISDTSLQIRVSTIWPHNHQKTKLLIVRNFFMHLVFKKSMYNFMRLTVCITSEWTNERNTRGVRGRKLVEL